MDNKKNSLGKASTTKL